MENQQVNRLVLLVASGPGVDGLTEVLRQEMFYFTVIDTEGAGSVEPSTCLLLGLSESRLPRLLELVHEHCQPFSRFVPAQMRAPGDLSALPMMEAQIGGASVHVMVVEHFEQI